MIVQRTDAARKQSREGGRRVLEDGALAAALGKGVLAPLISAGVILGAALVDDVRGENVLRRVQRVEGVVAKALDAGVCQRIADELHAGVAAAQTDALL